MFLLWLRSTHARARRGTGNKRTASTCPDLHDQSPDRTPCEHGHGISPSVSCGSHERKVAPEPKAIPSYPPPARTGRRPGVRRGELKTEQAAGAGLTFCRSEEPRKLSRAYVPRACSLGYPPRDKAHPAGW